MYKPSLVTWLAAWILLIAGGIALSKTSWGTSLLYYVIWLAIILLLITHYAEVEALFTAGNVTQGNV